MDALWYDPEGVPFPALTLTTAPTLTPSSVLMFFFNFGMYPTVLKCSSKKMHMLFSVVHISNHISEKKWSLWNRSSRSI